MKRFVESIKTGFAIALFVLIVIAALALRPAHAAGDANLTWTPANTCADGSAVTNCPVLAFQIEHKKVDGTWEPVVTVAPTLTAYKLTNLPPGTHEWRMLTSTLDNLLSDPSSSVSKKIPAAKPNPPTVTVQ